MVLQLTIIQVPFQDWILNGRPIPICIIIISKQNYSNCIQIAIVISLVSDATKNVQSMFTKCKGFGTFLHISVRYFKKRRKMIGCNRRRWKLTRYFMRIFLNEQKSAKWKVPKSLTIFLSRIESNFCEASTILKIKSNNTFTSFNSNLELKPQFSFAFGVWQIEIIWKYI